MKVRKGQASIKLPPIGAFVSVRWKDGIIGLGCDVKIIDSCSAAQVFGEIGSITGWPNYAHYSPEDGVLRFAPRPSAKGEMVIRYYPPLKEI